MTVHQLMSRKVTERTDPLGAAYWRTVSTFDWTDPVKAVAQVEPAGKTAAQILAALKSLRAAKYVAVQGYVNVQGNLADGVAVGGWGARFVRVGTSDDTGLQSQQVSVPPSQAGGAFGAHFATLPWRGANPGGFRLEVRHLPGFFDEFRAYTRFVKVEWLT